jgi:putative DNA primase/helicase
MRERLIDRARGRWPSILCMLGVEKRALSGKNGPCPMCGGRDRWRFTDRNGDGVWICNQCGAGDGVELVKRLRGGDFKAAAQAIEAVLGDAVPQEKPRDDGRVRDAVWRLWGSARPVVATDQVGLYLAGRLGVALPDYPLALRYAPSCRYADGRHLPAMLALVRAPDGSRATIHRTYLDGAGHKADVDSPRRLAPLPFLRGSSVWLYRPAEVMGIAEGIETAMSASILFGMPVWASLAAGYMESWEPPAVAREIVIYADNDMSLTGQCAAYSLGRRLIRAGLKARVEMPQATGTDWNDVLLRQLGMAA